MERRQYRPSRIRLCRNFTVNNKPKRFELAPFVAVLDAPSSDKSSACKGSLLVLVLHAGTAPKPESKRLMSLMLWRTHTRRSVKRPRSPTPFSWVTLTLAVITYQKAGKPKCFKSLSPYQLSADEREGVAPLRRRLRPYRYTRQ